MLTFKQFLAESIYNFVGNSAEKELHKTAVYDLVQKAYEPIGGIKGNGFNSADDMVSNIHMWKIHKKDGAIKAAVLYKKTPQGRKRVAVASDGSAEGKKKLGEMMTADYKQGRSHGEISGGSLKFLKKQIHVKDFANSFEEAQKYHAVNGDKIHRPPKDDPEVLAHPELANHFYQRELGGKLHTKLLVGSVGADFHTK